MNTMALPFLFSGLLFIALALPMAKRKVAPNPWYGFRTPKTLSNSDVWYNANAYAGRTMAWAGLATCAASLVLAFVPGLSDDVVAGWALGVMVPSLLVSLGFDLAYVNRLEAPVAGESGGMKDLPIEWAPGTLKLIVIPFILLGVLFIGVSVPLVQGTVPPNSTYGYRTAASMSSPEVWYASNRYSGQTLIAVGLVLMACAAALPFIRRVPEKAYVPILLGVMLAGLGISLYLSAQYTRVLVGG